MTDLSGSTSYGYDIGDRLVSKTGPVGGAVTFAYDLGGNLTQIGGSTPLGTNCSYDPLNRLATADTSFVPTMSYTYDVAGNLAGQQAASVISTSYTYDALNRLINMQSLCGTGAPGCGPANTPVRSYAYTLGAAGNRLSVAELSGRTVNYGYDDLYRLTSETVTGTASQNGTVSYVYDTVGNRLQRNSTLPAIPATGLLNYDANDRTSTDPYDANGNLLNGGVGSNVYDFENRLVAAGGVSIVYDGDGNRVQETVAAVTTKYLVSEVNPTGYVQVLAELSPSGQLLRGYEWGLQLVAQRDFTDGTFIGRIRLYGMDGHGSVRYFTDTNGAVTDTYDYDAFGALISSTGSTPNNYLFAGEQFDPALGIYYNRARYYDQRQGRFWTMDTFQGSPNDPITLHKYLYVGADPLDRADPRGNDFDLASLQTAGAAFTTLATTALVSFQNVLGSVYVNLYRIPQIIEQANTVATVAGGTFEILRLLGTNVLNYAESYSRGPVIRGTQFEEAAGANLSRTFPAIDYFDPNGGVAVQIRSTTQTQSPEALLAVVRRGVNRLNNLPPTLVGTDRAGDRVAIQAADIQGKALLVGIPAKPLPWFGIFLQRVRQISESEGVAITVQFVEGLEGETLEK
jgi:RHS repeat-associated protein